MSRAELTPVLVIQLEWFAWIVSWGVAAAWSARAVARAPKQAGYRIVTAAGAVLLFVPSRRRGPAHFSLWHPAPPIAWLLVAAAALGFLFTWWARIHLGTLWSSQVTRKEHHHIVDTGPYALVRHPIYTGLILATLATMALEGTAVAVAGTVLMIAGYYIKARSEERFLREQLGAAEYDAYARRVPMLMPLLPHG